MGDAGRARRWGDLLFAIFIGALATITVAFSALAHPSGAGGISGTGFESPETRKAPSDLRIADTAVEPDDEARDPRLLSITSAADAALRRIDLLFDRPVGIAWFTLDEPRRLVIDFATGDGRPPEVVGPMASGFGMPRTGLFTLDRARIVVPLERPFTVLRAGPRSHAQGSLVSLTLAPTDAESYRTTAGWPPGARWQGVGVPRPSPRPGAPGVVVAIDPGHGGIDPGAIVEGMSEKGIVLDFSRRLAEALGRMSDIQPVLTRERDVFLPLAERVRRATRAGADLFLSIHADIVIEGDAEGMSLYTLAPEATDRAAAELARRENRADLIAGADLSGTGDDLVEVLIELAQRETMLQSDRLAHDILETLEGRVTLLATRPLRQADFRVLKAPDIPSVLIELGFLTNERDRERLASPEWRQRAADAVARGVIAWVRRARRDGNATPPG